MRIWRVGSVALGLVAVGTLVVVLASSASGPADTSAASPLVGKPAPSLVGPTLDGGHYRLRPRSGKVTVVNIWASWCGPCRSEIPLLSRLSAKWSSGDVRLVTINTRDGPVAARTLLQEVGAKDLFTVLDPHGELAVTWGARGVPETVVVDRRGIVRSRWIGPVRRRWLTEQVDRWASS